MTPPAVNELRFEINILCFSLIILAWLLMLVFVLRVISLLRLPGHFREKWANDPHALKHLIQCK